MSDYWVEVHPESPTHILLCDSFLDILKRAGFNTESDSQILSTDASFTIIIYKNEYPDKQKSRFIGNRIIDFGYSNISKVYKKIERIPLIFEQEGKDFGTDFDVFVIDVLSDKTTEKIKDEPEDLGDIFV
jgi:hypothetical protein